MSTDDLHRPLYTADVVINALRQRSDSPLLLRLDAPPMSVGDVRDATSQYAQAFAEMGIGKGARIAVLSSNRPEVLIITLAQMLAATVAVPLHPMAGLNDHLYVIEDAKVDLLIFEAERYEGRAKELAAQVPGLKLASLGPSASAPDMLSLAASLSPKPLVAPRVDGGDIVRLGYSGGTTGKPKALASVQRVAFQTLSLMMTEWEWPNPPHVLSCAPLSHAGGAMFTPTLLRGGTMLILPGFDPLTVLQTIQDHRINCMMLVPTMIYALLDHPRFDEFDLSSLETVFYGASSISPARLKEAIERIGPVFSQFYGQAEAPMVLTVLRKAEHDVNDMLRLASCGRPAPWVNIELLDSNNQPVKDGEPGEICVRGPLVMDGYRDNAELTAAAFEGGWLHTGDVAIRDSQGFLRIVDRTKDMIISGGFNIYPREIEDILGEHPAISQVAVIGVPHAKWGEAVKALIVLRDGATADDDELVALVAARKGSYQAPKIIEYIESIPQTPVGKPDKKALRALYGAAADTATEPA